MSCFRGHRNEARLIKAWYTRSPRKRDNLVTYVRPPRKRLFLLRLKDRVEKAAVGRSAKNTDKDDEMMGDSQNGSLRS